MRCIAIGFLLVETLAASAFAQERQLLTFEVAHTPSQTARGVYLLGDIPELGADDLTRAVKLTGNGIPFGDAITDHTDTVALHPSGRIVYAHSSLDALLALDARGEH